MNTEKIETEKQDFMDEILELKKVNAIEDKNVLIPIIKSLIRYCTKNGGNQAQIYKAGGYITIMGINVLFKMNEDVAQYFIDQGFTVNEQGNAYLIMW